MRFKLLASTATSFSVISLYFDWLLVANLPNVSEKIKAASREKDKNKKKTLKRKVIFFLVSWLGKVGHSQSASRVCCLLHVCAGLFFGQAHLAIFNFPQTPPPRP